MNIEELRARLAELSLQASAIRDSATNAKRDLTADEADSLDQILNEFDSTDRRVKQIEGL